MLNRLMQLFMQFFSQHMSLLLKFNDNSNRHIRLISLTGRNTEPAVRRKISVESPKDMEEEGKNDKMFLW